MIIRTETPKDLARIATLLARTYQTQGVQAIEMASHIRKMEGRSDALSLVLEEEGDVCASAQFVPVLVGKQEGAVMLAQLALDTMKPDLDVRAFLNQAFEKVAAQGFDTLLLQGKVEEFEDDGFIAAQLCGVKGPHQPGAVLLAKPLKGDKPNLSGEVTVPDWML